MPCVSLRRVRALAGALIGTACLSACGGAGETVVAQVGHSTITRADVRHWTAVLGAGPNRTLEFLISSDWSLAEAARQDVLPSAHAVAHSIGQQRASVEGELHMELGGTQPSEADLRFKAQAQLAAAGLREKLLAHEPAIGEAEVSRYYRQHSRDFLISEVRYFEIDNLASQAQALKVKREIESGHGSTRTWLHEELSSGFGSDPGRFAVRRAVFAAKPNVLSGPVLLSDVKDHSLFEVRRIVPAHVRPLVEVRGEIVALLEQAWQQRALDEYNRALQARWRAQTHCSAGYVVHQCGG